MHGQYVLRVRIVMILGVCTSMGFIVFCLWLQIKTHEQVNRMEIYEKTVQVLGPEVAKAKELMRFVNSASARLE